MKIFKTIIGIFRIAILALILGHTSELLGQGGGGCYGATAQDMLFTSSGGTISRTIQPPSGCSGGTWSIVGRPSWMPSQPTISGTYVTATMPSYTGSERIGYIYLGHNGNTVGSIKVYQNKGNNPPPPPPPPPPPSCSINGFGGDSNFAVLGEQRTYNLTYSNCPSTVYYTFKEVKNGNEVDLPSWVQVTQNATAKTVTVNFSQNSGTGSRNIIIIGKRQDGGSPGIGSTFVQDCIEKNWYADSDGDGFRNPGSTAVMDCADTKSGYTRNAAVDSCPDEPYSSNNGCLPPCSADLSEYLIEISKDGGSDTITLSNFSAGCIQPRTISYGNKPNWLNISVSGYTLNLSAGANADYNSRGDQITVLVNGETINSFVVSQNGQPQPPEPCAAEITVNGQVASGQQVNLNPNGETFEIDAIFNRSSCEELIVLRDPISSSDIPDWLQPTPVGSTSGPFTLSPGENASYNSRSAYVGIASANNPNTIFDVVVVTQLSCFEYYYLDSDGDGFGDVYGTPRIQCTDPDDEPDDDPTDFWVSNNDDLCPYEPTSGYANGCPNGEQPEDFNSIASKSYDIDGTLKAADKSYFDELGKLIQSQNWNLRTNDTWVSEIRYDRASRLALQTLSAPVRTGNDFMYEPMFIRKKDDPTKEYLLSDFIGDFSEVGEADNTLGWYYSDLNDREIYQDATDYPFSYRVYSTLNPSMTLRTLGGNKVDTNRNGDIDSEDKWANGYSFKMKASQELSQSVAFGDTSYDDDRIWKMVSRDVHGVENVVFTDSEDKVLAIARSGGPTKRAMTVSVGPDGFVDVHIPEGSSGISIANTAGGSADVSIYDLILDEDTDLAPGNLPPGFYRIAVTNWSPANYSATQPFTVSYEENYYDYSLNEYDEADRLKFSYQPLGSSKGAKPKTTYSYNSLGHLISVDSPDEGFTRFIYRTDGQIRFSQNSKQADDNEVSFTNYDPLGRPIKSGVWVGADFSSLNENSLIGSNLKEVLDTTYDYIDPDTYASEGVPSDYRNQSFLAGNVAKTENENTETWYSYDVYGRIKWLAQKIVDIGFKTTDYVYHPVTGLVSEVVFQKGIDGEEYTVKYLYDTSDQLTEVQTAFYNSPFKTHAQYEYYENGTLKRTKIAPDSQGNPIQGIDYVYNLAGQLKAINHPSQSSANDPGNDNLDLFGMQIDYHNNDYNRTVNNIVSPVYGQDNFNGNIKGIRWNNGRNPMSNGNEGLYAYTYDRNDWLKKADFAFYNGNDISNIDPTVEDTNVYNSGDIENKEATQSITLGEDFHAKSGSTYSAKIVLGGGVQEVGNGDYDVTGIEYDANGNIQQLKRNKHNADDGISMDDLSYVYKTDPQNGPNQLLQVVDIEEDVAGADDIDTQAANNYSYNKIGQLISNVSEGIFYIYNASGLVIEVQKNSKPMVKFYYNDRNHRVKKEFFDGSGSLVLETTYYVNDISGNVLAIYEKSQSNPVVLREHPIYGQNRIGVIQRTGNTGVTYYELTDHLGNVRAIFSENNSSTTGESFTDYYPFGMPMPGRNVVGDYRYGYQGQYAEKEPELGEGINSFQLRLWDSRIGRWLGPDPYGQFASPYLGMGNNPIRMVDPDGGYCEDAQGNPIPCDQVAFGDLYEGPTAATLIALDEVVVTPLQSKLNEHSSNMGTDLANGYSQTGFVFNSLAKQTDRLKPLAQIGRFDPKFQTDFLNRSASTQMGNVYSKDALKTISKLKTGLKVLGTSTVVAGYYSPVKLAYEGDYYTAAIEGSANTVGVGVGYYLGIGPGLGWTAGWEGGKYFWNSTEIGQDIAWRYLRFHLPDSKKPPQYRKSIILGD